MVLRSIDHQSRIITIAFPPTINLDVGKYTLSLIADGIQRLSYTGTEFSTLLDFSEVKRITPAVSELWVEFAIGTQKAGLDRSARIVASPYMGMATALVGWHARMWLGTRSFLQEKHAEAWVNKEDNLSTKSLIKKTGQSLVITRPDLDRIENLMRAWQSVAGGGALSDAVSIWLDGVGLPNNIQEFHRILQFAECNLEIRTGMLDLLGYMHSCMSQSWEAESFLMQSASLAIRIRHWRQLAATLLHLAEFHELTEQYELARAEAARAVDLAARYRMDHLVEVARKRFLSADRAVSAKDKKEILIEV